VGLTTAATGYWLYRQRTYRARTRPTYPSPASLVLPLPEPATAVAISSSSTDWQLSWTGRTDAPTAIFAALDLGHPDQFDWETPLASEPHAPQTVRLSLPAPHPRPIFALRFADGVVWYTAVRQLPTPSILNLRDIGGYQTASGQQLRWGCIYRSGDLASLSDADTAFLQQLNLRVVCDLRTSEEVEKSPNRQWGEPTLHLHHPIYERNKADGHWLRSVVFTQGDLAEIWLNQVYIARFIESCAPAFGRVLTMCADTHNYPLLVHCTAGKDRTGLSIALLLALLGVPDETIVADYTLSNLFYEQLLESVSADARRLAVFGIQTDDLFPLLTAPEYVLRATFAHIRGQYGSIEAYVLGKGQVTAVTLTHLREKLLYPV
jgi:protein-tyrosine phosphatase